MRSFAFVLSALAGSLLFLSAPAQALPDTYDLSEMTSEQDEIDGMACAGVTDCGTPAGVLEAFVTVALDGDNLKITVENDTSGGAGAGNYDISEIWLNIAGVTVDSISPLGMGALATSVGFDLVSGPTMVDGFGDFSVGIVVHGDVNQNPDLITPTEVAVITLGCSDIGGCAAATLVDTSQFKQVAVKFINGGAVYDESVENDPFGSNNDSAFGASGSGGLVPEPSTLGLALAGLAGLALIGRRGR